MKMWLQWVNWRIDFRPDLITKNDVKDIPLAKLFKLYKTDHDGRPVVIMAPGDLDMDDVDIESSRKV